MILDERRLRVQGKNLERHAGGSAKVRLGRPDLVRMRRFDAGSARG